MDYSKSYMFFGLVLFGILSSQVLTATHVHKSSITESNLPSMVVQSTDERILEFKKTCSLFDNGKDGCIPTNAELQVIKNEIDVGGTSYVAHLLDWIREIFIKFDEDHNHFISVDEFRHFTTNLDKHEMKFETADGAVYAYDHNGDGQLNLDEFTHIVIVMIKDKDKF